MKYTDMHNIGSRWVNFGCNICNMVKRDSITVIISEELKVIIIYETQRRQYMRSTVLAWASTLTKAKTTCQIDLSYIYHCVHLSGETRLRS